MSPTFKVGGRYEIFFENCTINLENNVGEIFKDRNAEYDIPEQ